MLVDIIHLQLLLTVHVLPFLTLFFLLLNGLLALPRYQPLYLALHAVCRLSAVAAATGDLFEEFALALCGEGLEDHGRVEFLARTHEARVHVLLDHILSLYL